jgi:hypothetical protein
MAPNGPPPICLILGPVTLVSGKGRMWMIGIVEALCIIEALRIIIIRNAGRLR